MSAIEARLAAALPYVGGPRGPKNHHAMVRLADEGVPIAALARAFKMPFREADDAVRSAKERGEIAYLPSRDWPHGQVRYVPSNGGGAPAGFSLISLDEAREAVPYCLRLSRSQVEILAALMSRDLATKNWLHNVLYGHLVDGGADPKIIHVQICKMRKALAPFDIAIITVWGGGYRLSVEDRNKVVALKVCERVAA